MPSSLRSVVGLALVAGLTTTCFGQLPQPRLQGLARAGVRAGESVDVTVRGTDLEGVNALWFDHPGLRAFWMKGQTFRVVCAPGTPVGIHDVRAVGTYGLTNPRAFVIGDRPETVEVEPNNTPAQATPIGLNSVVNGEFGGADVDCFAFDGKKGRRVFLDLAGERIDSRADATLHLLGPDGREFAEDRDTFGADPFLDVTLPADGRYVVKVHDVIYGGSPEHVYRLTLHDGPHLDAIVPVIAPMGTASPFTLIARGPGADQPLERLPVTITPDPNAPVLSRVVSSAATREGFEYMLTGPSGVSNPVFVGAAVDPVVVEQEPNDDAEHAQTVALPCDISGTFGAAGDTDVYRFQARKGDVWRIEAEAERLGSAADPTFVVQKVNATGPPQDLATGDDQPDPGASARFHLGTIDASVRWQAPDDGTYLVVINDLYGSQRGDHRLTYRLNFRPERPDFRLFVVPESLNQLDAVTIRAGGRARARVIAWRLDGFTGPIRVEAVELPPGVTCDPVVIAAGQTVAPLVFAAAPDALSRVGPARLVGRGRVGDQKEHLDYVPGAATLGPDVVHEALGGAMVHPPGNPQAPAFAAARLTRGFIIAVSDSPAPLALTARAATRVVAQGHQLPIDVTVTRREGFVEAVAVTATDLPPTIPAATVTIAKDAVAGTLALFVPKTVAPGLYTFVVQGTGPFPFSKDPTAKPKPNVNLAEPSDPITIVVRPAPVNLAVDNKGGALKAGGPLEVEVTVTRQNGFTGAAALTLVAPPSLKLSAAAVTIGATETKAKLIVQSAADSPPGAVANVAVRALATVNGAPIEVDEPLALTINK